MNIEEAKKLKQALEQDVKSLLNKYEDETQLEINDFSFESLSQIATGRKHVVNVDILVNV